MRCEARPPRCVFVRARPSAFLARRVRSRAVGSVWERFVSPLFTAPSIGVVVNVGLAVLVFARLQRLPESFRFLRCWERRVLEIVRTIFSI